MATPSSRTRLLTGAVAISGVGALALLYKGPSTSAKLEAVVEDADAKNNKIKDDKKAEKKGKDDKKKKNKGYQPLVKIFWRLFPFWKSQQVRFRNFTLPTLVF